MIFELLTFSLLVAPSAIQAINLPLQSAVAPITLSLGPFNQAASQNGKILDQDQMTDHP